MEPCRQVRQPWVDEMSTDEALEMLDDLLCEALCCYDSSEGYSAEIESGREKLKAWIREHGEKLDSGSN